MKLMMKLFVTSLLLLTFNACSKEPSEPYYDRAKQASEDAHNQLRKD